MPRPRRDNPMTANMLGLLGMDPNQGGQAADDDEADLNAELSALLAGEAAPAPKKRGSSNEGAAGGKKAPLSLEAQLAMALKDPPDDDHEDDTNDGDLMAELNDLMEEGPDDEPSSPVKEPAGSHGSILETIEERLEDYQLAVAMAESTGDASKARRYRRAMQDLEEQRGRARAGQTVSAADLPGPVPASSKMASPVTEQPPSPKRPQPPASKPQPPVSMPEPPASKSAGDVATLTTRRDQYKMAALKAKQAGDLDTARRHIAVAKQFDAVIAALEAGQPVDLSQMPPPPGSPEKAQEARQRSTEPISPAGPPKSLQDDLQQRMAVLQQSQAKATEEGNSSKARRLNRQVAAYKEAIAACRAKRPFDVTELAVPPGFEPLKPVGGAGGEGGAPPAPAAAPTPKAPPAAAAAAPANSMLTDLQQRMAVLQQSQAKATEEGNSSKARRLNRQVAAYKEAIAACRAKRPYDFSELAVPPGFEPLASTAPPAPAPAPASAPAAAPGTRGPPPVAGARQAGPGRLQRQLSRSANQTLVFLQDRQRQFKEAALKAKREGKKDLALSLLRQAKGFDPMIAASANGLPVDMSKLPPLPGEKEVDFEFLQAEDCEAPEDMQSDDPKVLFKQLSAKLQAQINLCRANSARCVKMGDVMTASKFDRLLKTSQLDQAALRSAEAHGDQVPRFHFEWKTFTTERTNPDLGEDALELQVLRGIDLEAPSGYANDQLDTYVRAELPFPSSEETQVCRTEVVRSTNCPEYANVHKFSVNKKARTFQRLIKSRAIKAEVFYKRGFLKGDKVLGTATIKLADLESHCEIHNSYDLVEGRKTIGGRLEVRVRLREPVGGRQVEETREKWLVIDAASRPTSAATGPGHDPQLASGTATQSIEVMKYERDLLAQELRNRKSQLSPAAQDSLQAKGRQLERSILAQDTALREGGPTALKAYAAAIEKLAPTYTAEARQALKDNNRNKASVLMTKKKLCEKEAAAIRSRVT